ncbi:unannotated protein [freshwater metagenome]|uniref:Unannotated protein n=1 Tax=freshwater metagenome TaxID=449393 RepID=A0A6J7IT53_9ZZZZ
MLVKPLREHLTGPVRIMPENSGGPTALSTGSDGMIGA